MRRQTLPGFGLSLGITLAWLGAIVLLPLAALAWKAGSLGPSGWWSQLASRRVWRALELSFGGALVAAAVDLLLGLLLA